MNVYDRQSVPDNAQDSAFQSPLRDPQGKSQEGFLSVVEFVAFLRRRARLITAVFLVVTLIGLALALATPPRYKSTALVKINPVRDRVLSDNQALSDFSPNDAFIDSEIEVLRSPELVVRLIEAMDLQTDPEWNSDLRAPTLVESIKGVFKQDQSYEVPITDDFERYNHIITALAEDISIRRRGLTYVMEVTVSSGAPDKSAALANKLTELYLRGQTDAQFESAESANSWLSQRLDQLKQEVQLREGAVQSYRAEKGLLTAEGVSLVEAQIADVQSDVVSARAEYAEKIARYEQVASLIRSGGSADSIAGVLTSDVIRDLRIREAEVAQRQADLESRFGPLYPDVEKIRLERQDIKDQISAEITRIAANLKNEADVVRTRLNTLQTNLAQVRRDLVSNNEELVRLNELETDAKAARAVYESFLMRYHEVADQGELSTIDAQVISMARRPASPFSPNIPMTVIISSLLGLALGIGAALLLEPFRNVLSSPEDVETKTGYPALVSIPVVSNRDLRTLPIKERHPAGYLLANPMSAFAEAFRVLKTSIGYAGNEKPSKVIAITSAIPSEGKTTTAFCLARTAATAGQKVILVDCDLRRRSLNELLDISPREGLVEVLTQKKDWKAVVGTDEASGAHVIPSAETSAFSPRDLFSTDAMEDLIDELSSIYDLVVLDCAPVLAVADARVVVTHADAVILACRWAKTHEKAVMAALQQLKGSSTRIVGLALNLVDPKAPGKSSYYDSLYYGDAKDYYREG